MTKEYYEINQLCTCGGFFSNLNAITHWLYLIDGNEEMYNLRLHCGKCWVNKCDWQQFLKGYDIWKKMFKPLKCNLINRKSQKKLYYRATKKYIKASGIKGCCFGMIEVEPFKRSRDKNNNKILIKNKNPRVPLPDKFKRLYDINLKLDSRIHTTYYHPNFNEYRHNIYKAYKRQLIPNDWLQKKINVFYNKYFDKSTYYIGVHIRSSYKYKMEHIGTKGLIKHYMRDIDKLTTKHKNKQIKIYLATSLQKVVNIFKNKYGNMIIYNFNNKNMLKNVNINLQDWDRNANVVDECTNVYLDTVILSKCDIIIAGCSNIFYNSLLMNPNNDFIIPKILHSVRCR